MLFKHNVKKIKDAANENGAFECSHCPTPTQIPIKK